MKHLLRLLTCVLIALILGSLFTLTVFASEETSFDYAALFSQANEVDGMAADKHATVLADCYDTNPNGFIHALTEEDASTVNNVIHLLVYEYQYRDLNALIAHMNDLIAQEADHDAVVQIADSIISCVDFIQTPSQTDPDPSTPEFIDTAFNPSVVRKILDAYLRTSTSENERFCNYASKMYQKSPELFAQTVADLPEEQIAVLGECIALDMVETKTTPPVISASASPSLRLLSGEISTSYSLAQSSEKDVLSAVLPSISGETRSSIPTIVSLTTSNAKADVGETITFALTIRDTTNPYSLVIYHAELFEIINGQENMIGDGFIALVPGKTQETYLFGTTFETTGQKSFYVKLFRQYEDKLLTDARYNNALSVYGELSISITLPNNRNNLGCLTVYDAGGSSVYQAICLGCSVSGAAPSVYKGNTPTGVYRGHLIGPDSDTEAYGPYKVINMTGISGQIIECSNRSQICIHGGRDGTVDESQPNYPLAKTNGCVRITTAFQGALIETLEDWISNYYYAAGEVSITESNSSTVSHPPVDPGYEDA